VDTDIEVHTLGQFSRERQLYHLVRIDFHAWFPWSRRTAGL